MEKICKKCNKRKKSSEFYNSKYTNDGLGYYCKTCLKKTKQLCDFCKNNKIIYKKIDGKAICSSCFRKHTLPTKICSICGKKSFLVKSDPPTCKSCYDKYGRFGICSRCGRTTKIKLKDSVCQYCYHTSRKDICDFCSKEKRIAKMVGPKKMCISCYDKQPENIVKRFNKNNECGISPNEWLHLMREFDWKCFYCETKLNDNNRTIDHIIAKHIGGTNDINNFVPCCRKCNGNKGTKDIFKWAEEIHLSSHKVEFLKRRLAG